MALEKRTIKIILIVTVTLFIIGGLLGLVLGIILNQRPYIVLEVWPQREDTDLPLIQFNVNDSGSWHPWVRRINEFLSVYENPVPEDPPRAPCSIRPRHEETQRSVTCDHAMRYWEPCTVDTLYGYIMGKPCVFLRLSHIDNWTPHPYNISGNLPIPIDMPEHLLQGLKHPSARYEDYIWISCKEESISDEDNIGRIQYIPDSLPPGIPIRRLRTDDTVVEGDGIQTDKDRGPVIAVFFPNLRHGVIVNVECRIWTRDVVYDGMSNVGRTRFEILIN